MLLRGGIRLVLLAYLAVRGASETHHCHRPCTDSGTPRHCNYNFTLAAFFRNCNNVKKEECRRRVVLTVNGDSPGPMISVCRHDIITVDVKNALPNGMETSIHWHGLRQRGTPYADGVTMITQCPIHSGTTFRYRFEADEAGTFYYHAHSVLQQMDGVFGALIVRKPTDGTDDPVILVHPVLHSSSTVANEIDTELVVMELQSKVYLSPTGKVEKTSRMVRLINAAALDCPVNVSIENNTLAVIAVDGNDITVIDLEYLLLYPGERADFLLDGSSPKDIIISGRHLCAGHGVPVGKTTLADDFFPVSNSNSYGYLQKLMSDSPLAVPSPGAIRVFIPFDMSEFRNLDRDVDLRYILGDVAPHVPSYLSSDPNPVSVYQFRNISFLYPSSPLLFGTSSFDEDFVCYFGARSSKCRPDFCECLHLLPLPFNETVDLIFIDQGKRGRTAQTLHIHGHSFYVMAIGSFEEPVTMEEVRRVVESTTGIRSPVQKDTVVVPKNGYVSLRLRTDNPGPWLVESIPSKAETGLGLEMVLLVSDTHRRIDVPDNFPRCSTVKPPDLVILDD